MTRQEFIDNVTSWHELLAFCSDNECSECDNVYDADQRDESIDRNLVGMARDADGWRELRDALYDIPTFYDYYEDTDSGWHGLDDDDDFQRYKQYVAEWMDNGGYWDEEYEEDDEEQYEDSYHESQITDEDGISVEDETIPIYELFALCNSQLQSIDSK